MSEELQTEYAGFWRRLVALWIDAVLFFIVSSLIPIIVYGVTGGVVSLMELEWLNTWLFLLTAAVCWRHFEGTPGQLMMGCYVVDAKTQCAVSYKQAGIRALGYILSFLPLLLGFLWIAWDKRKQGWHDKLAGTVVLLDRKHERYDESQKSLEQLVKELR